MADGMHESNICSPESSPIQARGLKRKHSTPQTSRDADHVITRSLEALATEIKQGLGTVCTNETIHLCGHASLAIISSRPNDVLQLAYQQLNARPYADVEICWRRLHEEASLYQVIAILSRDEASANRMDGNGKRAQSAGATTTAARGCLDVLDLIITVLDRSIMISGCPGRRRLFDAIFLRLRTLLSDDQMYHEEIPGRYRMSKPSQVLPLRQVSRYDTAIGLEAYQLQLEKAQPCMIPKVLEHWPALELWQDPTYLIQVTLGGRRLVPVEIGSSYVEEGWAQRIMPMHEFMQTYVLSEKPPAVGYLAQYDLFEHLPELRNDIITPDYCYTSPPAPNADTLKTAGLSSVKHVDVPLRNAWFGPKGTKTPLHTDPYHNILCQVVGYKYVRLYDPSETPRLYARGVDENGISMENTSAIDISLIQPGLLTTSGNASAAIEQETHYPLFREAKYVEIVLAPGESLYIPVGWWHYVESLSTSFSVSFWWN